MAGNTDSENIRSITLSKTKVFFGSFCLILFLVLTGGLIFRVLQISYTNYQLLSLRKENKILEETFQDWKRRMDDTSALISELQKKNQQIRMTAGLTAAEMPLGIGGPESELGSRFIDFPEIRQPEKHLSKLEADLHWLKQRTLELDQILANRTREIAHFPSIRPVRKGWITSRFGIRLDPFTGREDNHPGLDIAIAPGSEVCATGAGRVKTVVHKFVKNKSYGKYIVIDHGYGYQTLYGHLSEIFVEQGQLVKRWDLIGLSGNTGKSTAPHIHYEVQINGQPSDPVNFILE